MLRRLLGIIVVLVLILPSYACGGGGPVAPPGPDGTGRPAGYDLLFPTKVARWDIAAFPLDVFIDAPPAIAGRYGSTMQMTAKETLTVWNGQISSATVLFRNTDNPDDADITVRWQDDTKGAYTRAVDSDDHIAIHKIALSEELRDPARIRVLLGHELGHVLGLGHSQVNGDLMYPVLEPEKTSLTDRDREMLKWLYDQDTYAPIRTY